MPGTEMDNRSGRTPDALRIGLLGPLQVWDGTGRVAHVGGRQLRVLLILLALEAGRVVPPGSLAGQIWPDEPPSNPGNALQTLVSRLRAELRQASLDHVIESHPAGYRLAVPPDAVDALDFETLAVRGRRALAGGLDRISRVISHVLILVHAAVRTRTPSCRPVPRSDSARGRPARNHPARSRPARSRPAVSLTAAAGPLGLSPVGASCRT
jgi:hypothetical protein